MADTALACGKNMFRNRGCDPCDPVSTKSCFLSDKQALLAVPTQRAY